MRKTSRQPVVCRVLNDGDVTSNLREHLKHGNPKVRAAAIRGLSALTPKSAIDEMATILATSESDSDREAAEQVEPL